MHWNHCDLVLEGYIWAFIFHKHFDHKPLSSSNSSEKFGMVLLKPGNVTVNVLFINKTDTKTSASCMLAVVCKPTCLPELWGRRRAPIPVAGFQSVAGFHLFVFQPILSLPVIFVQQLWVRCRLRLHIRAYCFASAVPPCLSQCHSYKFMFFSSLFSVL